MPETPQWQPRTEAGPALGKRGGIELGQQELTALYRRSDVKGIVYFGGWLALTAAAGGLYYLSLGTYWVVPALLLYGAILVFGYAMSHETSHGTAFRSRWLNEGVYWFTSLIYGQEPVFRRYAHAAHHRHTQFRDLDAQMAWHHPLTLWRYVRKISGLDEVIGFPRVVRHALGQIPDSVRAFAPEKQWPRLIWGARIFLGIHVAFIAGFALAHAWWVPFVFFYGPRIVGGPLTNNVFDITQHGEMKEDVHDMRETTRSVRTTWLTNFIYSNMSYHLEHHMYPMVPFHALPALNRRICDELPTPATGFYRTNVQILRAIFDRMHAGRGT